MKNPVLCGYPLQDGIFDLFRGLFKPFVLSFAAPDEHERKRGRHNKGREVHDHEMLHGSSSFLLALNIPRIEQEEPQQQPHRRDQHEQAGDKSDDERKSHRFVREAAVDVNVRV